MIASLQPPARNRVGDLPLTANSQAVLPKPSLEKR
jgi:hypothetical protein